jgi:hypothetical protein
VEFSLSAHPGVKVEPVIPLDAAQRDIGQVRRGHGIEGSTAHAEISGGGIGLIEALHCAPLEKIGGWVSV